MPSDASSRIAQAVEEHASELLDEWIGNLSTSVRRADLISEAELRSQCAEFLQLLIRGARQGDLTSIHTGDWAPMRELLASISRSRALQGFTPRETALFIFSFKEPFFTRLRGEVRDADTLAETIQCASNVLDELGLWTTEVYQQTREDIIARQQQELLELSTPVVKLWTGVLAVPLIGTLDSARTQTVMESLLQMIVQTGAEIAIIDITGVPTVDTLTAQHLLKTVTAARLMGAECIISGIRPQIAQTIVHLGVDLGEIVTKASLADAFALALSRAGFTVSRLPARAG